VVEGRDMMLAAYRIASRLRLSGFFGLDFIIEEGTGATHLIELNPRSTPLCHLRLGGCHDMVGAFSAQFLGQPVSDCPPITENKLIAYFPQAYQANSPWLDSSFHDIPSEEPELVRDLLNPWLERVVFARQFDYLYGWKRRLMLRGLPGGIQPTRDTKNPDKVI